MLIGIDKLVTVLRKVRNLREHLVKLCPAPQGPIISIMDLHWAIQDMYVLRIEMWEAAYDGEHVVGALLRFPKFDPPSARIYVKAGQSEEERRYAAAKELSQIVIDEPDDFSTLGVETLSALLVEWKLASENGVGHPKPSDVLQSEQLAEIAAIELMYPFEFRANDLKKIENGETSIARIALEHRVPEHAIEQAFRHHVTIANCWAIVSSDMDGDN